MEKNTPRVHRKRLLRRIILPLLAGLGGSLISFYLLTVLTAAS